MRISERMFTEEKAVKEYSGIERVYLKLLNKFAEEVAELEAENERLREILFDADGVLEWLEGDSEPWPTEKDAMVAWELRKRIEALLPNE